MESQSFQTYFPPNAIFSQSVVAIDRIARKHQYDRFIHKYSVTSDELGTDYNQWVSEDF